MLYQKKKEQVIKFWDSTAEWRMTYFDKLKITPDTLLSEPSKLEKEFVIAEDKRISELIHPAEVILELGCGVGRSILKAIERWKDKTFCGVDFAPHQLKMFHKQIRERRLVNAFPVLANTSSLPFCDNSFDLVLICNQTFGTFLGDVRLECLKELRRLIIKAGRLMIGGFTKIEFAPACYQEWGVICESVDFQTGFVSLEHYNSLWQRESKINAVLAEYGFKCCDSIKAGLGFINTYEL